jgi:hypothetical protein
MKPAGQPKLETLHSPEKILLTEGPQPDRKMGNKTMSTNELRKLPATNRVSNPSEKNAKASTHNPAHSTHDAGELLAQFLKQSSHEKTE